MTVSQDSSNNGVDADAFIDPAACAARAGLEYVSVADPGLTRKKWGRGFTYLKPDGSHVMDEGVRDRIDDLAIPPAWTEVWISMEPSAHIQVTGRDAEGRKQYIYHPEWERVRNEIKFTRTVAFGENLADLRRHCRRKLRKKRLSRDKVLAAVVFLLDQTLARIGNESYAERNESFGITTLRDWHVDFSGTHCTFEFPGKSGKQHHIEMNDPRLARIVRKCRDVPGQELFQYYDPSGERKKVDSSDVNAFLKDVTGEPFTAKDFRTWGATVHAAVHLHTIENVDTEKGRDKKIVEMVKVVAEELGNTPAVCRNYYIHPHVVRSYREGSFIEIFDKGLKRKRDGYLRREEKALLHFFNAWGPDAS